MHDFARLLGRLPMKPKGAVQMPARVAGRIEPKFASLPPPRKPAHGSGLDHVALGAANFLASFSLKGFAEAFEAAAAQWRPRASSSTPASSVVAAEVLAASRTARALQINEPLPADPKARAVILAAQRARGGEV